MKITKLKIDILMIAQNFMEGIYYHMCNNKDDIVLIHHDKKITYDELNSLSSSYMHLLKNLGVKKGDIIAVGAARSIYTIAFLLGCIRLNAIYVSLNSLYNYDPLNILESCKPKIIIKDILDKTFEKINISSEIILLNIQDLPTYTIQTKDFSIPSANDYCCIMYTSGTTGNPKAIAKTYKNINTMFLPLLNNKSAKKIVGQNGSLNAPLSLYQIYGTLSLGGICVIIDDDIKNDPKTLVKLCNNYKITKLNFAPNRFEEFLRYISVTGDNLPFLLEISCTGSRLDKFLMFKFNEILPNVTLINSYGTTEVGGIASFKFKGEDSSHIIYPHVSVKIIDENNKVLAQGEIGTITVSSEAVGYYYDKHKTSSCANIMINEDFYYNTGDLGILDSNQNLKLIGRNIFEIKILGRRIQMQEIEFQIKKHLCLTECALLHLQTNEESHKFICFFGADKILDIRDLKQQLAAHMMSECIPDLFIQIQHMPYLHNDKIDYQRLKQYYLEYSQELITI